jgi:hypothetical protein
MTYLKFLVELAAGLISFPFTIVGDNLFSKPRIIYLAIAEDGMGI